MKFKVAALVTASILAGVSSQPVLGATTTVKTDHLASLEQCVALQTSGADRILTARWLFAVMSTSPQIADLAAVTSGETIKLNKNFAQLLTRLVAKDCVEQVRPLAEQNPTAAFESAGRALGEIAMKELMQGKEVDKSVSAYTDYLSEADFKSLFDSLPKKSSK